MPEQQNVGKVVEIKGVVIDVAFTDTLPEINTALKIASITTPFISITLPTFLVLPLSAMGLLKRVDRGAPEGCAQAPA